MLKLHIRQPVAGPFCTMLHSIDDGGAQHRLAEKTRATCHCEAKADETYDGDANSDRADGTDEPIPPALRLLRLSPIRHAGDCFFSRQA